MSRFKPTLTDEQRWNLAGACLANSADLLDDAVALLRSDRLPRGAFLLLVAWEEMLKARYCLRPPSAT
jgi:AbiV family abortive infection protein